MAENDYASFSERSGLLVAERKENLERDCPELRCYAGPTKPM